MRLGIVFQGLSDRVLQRVQEILRLPGPCRLSGEPIVQVEEDPNASEGEYSKLGTPPRDRRLGTRAELNQEVVALDHDSAQIKYLLVSSDLSVDGLRVEAHPSIALEDQVDVVLYEDSETDMLILSAVVARDDGRRGWWLRFVGVTPEIRDRLVKVLDRFPPVTRLDNPDGESGRVVLCERVGREKSSETQTP